MHHESSGYVVLDLFFFVILAVMSNITGSDIIKIITGIGGVLYLLNQLKIFIFSTIVPMVKAIKARMKK